MVQKLKFRNCFLIAWDRQLNPKSGFEIAQNSKPAARLRPPFGHSSSSIDLPSRTTTSAQKLCIQACALLATNFNPRPVHTTSNACGMSVLPLLSARAEPGATSARRARCFRRVATMCGKPVTSFWVRKVNTDLGPISVPKNSETNIAVHAQPTRHNKYYL